MIATILFADAGRRGVVIPVLHVLMPVEFQTDRMQVSTLPIGLSRIWSKVLGIIDRR